MLPGLRHAPPGLLHADQRRRIIEIALHLRVQRHKVGGFPRRRQPLHGPVRRLGYGGGKQLLGERRDLLRHQRVVDRRAQQRFFGLQVVQTVHALSPQHPAFPRLQRHDFGAFVPLLRRRRVCVSCFVRPSLPLIAGKDAAQVS